MKSYWPAILALFLLPLLAWLIPYTEFQTNLEIISTPSQVSFIVNGQTITEPLALHGLRALEILTVESAFPMGGTELTLEQNGRVLLRERLPARFATKPGQSPSLGDWWVDDYQVRPSHLVYRRELTNVGPPSSSASPVPVASSQESEKTAETPASPPSEIQHSAFSIPHSSLNGPFRLRLGFTGRCLQDTKIRLLGDSGAEFWFRAGLINNDFLIKNQDGMMASQTVGLCPDPDRHARNILEPVLRALFVACLLVILFTFLGLISRVWTHRSSKTAEPPQLKTQNSELRTQNSLSTPDLPITRSPDLPITRSPDPPIPRLPDPPIPPSPHPPILPWLSVALLALAGFLLSLWVADRVLERLPHFQDDLCYLLRAKWLSIGWLSLPMPAFWESLNVPHTYFNTETGRWLTIYPIGWPLLLTAGQWLGYAWVVPCVCGAIGMILIYLLGRELYGHWTGYAAMLLAILSPMSVLMSASLLSHAATAMFLTLFFYWLITGWKQQSRWRMAAAGLALGYTFGIRPLTAVAVAFPAGVFLVIEVIANWLSGDRVIGGSGDLKTKPTGFSNHQITRSPDHQINTSAIGNSIGSLRLRSFICLSLLILGGLAGTIPTLIDNYQATGHPFLFAYTAGPKQHHWTLDNLSSSLQMSEATLATVLPMAFGWGYRLISGWPALSLTYAFALVVFLSGRATKYDWLLLGAFVAVPLAYLGHDSTGAHGFGPRLYYDVFFTLFLLTARGFAVLSELPGARLPGARLPGAMSVALNRHVFSQSGSMSAPSGQPDPAPARPHARTPLLPRVLAISLFLALCLSAALTLPGRVKMYQGYNFVSRDLEDAVAKAHLTRGIILLDNPSHYDWITAANVLPADPNHSDLIIATKLDDNTILFEARPDLPVFLWSGGVLMRYP